MIKLTQLTDIFEAGLNSSLSKVIGTDNVQFKIWAEAGEHQKPKRQGNEVTYFIEGNLRTATSANDANALIMGVNGLSLTFSVPIQQPRTDANQRAEELQRIKDGQFPFIQKVASVLNNYFQLARAIILDDLDDSTKRYSVAFRAGTVIPGSVDLSSVLNNHILMDIYIEVYFIEGGISSKDFLVYFDNSIIPFQAVRCGRSPMVERDVYSGDTVSKNVVTSTAFAIDVDIPANSDKFTEACLEYLLNGEPNVSHFVNVNIKNTDYSKLFFMTLNNMQSSATGINIVGCSASLMEVVDSAQGINIPKSYMAVRVTVVRSGGFAPQVSIKINKAAYSYIKGFGAQVWEANTSYTKTLTYKNFEENEENDGKNNSFIIILSKNAIMTIIGLNGTQIQSEIIQRGE